MLSSEPRRDGGVSKWTITPTAARKISLLKQRTVPITKSSLKRCVKTAFVQDGFALLW